MEEAPVKFQLQIAQGDRLLIEELITTLGEKNLARLLIESRRLTEIGKRIDHVPPLQFIGFVVRDPYLKDCLRKVYKSYFKWLSFVDGFSGSMEKEDRMGLLEPQLPGFAVFVGIDVEILERLTYDQDWEGFIRALI
jgi:hypothetical protein